MHATTILFSLMAVAVSAKSLKYTVPSSLKAAAASNCTMPAEYMIHNFTTYTDKADSTKNTTSFHFVDPGTNISSHCLSDSSSKPTGAASNRWPCENPNVEFIYQTTGIVGLTIIEIACPGSKPQFEASDLVDIKLECQDSDSETTCVQTEKSVDGEFDSLQPTPQSPPSRRRRTH
ncbi:hypothetical protein F5X99DRAFT_387718 [Biscogniauxia marginata]|nr:hypothetical protein F5X99DRAFT_387718 [Biscogniauxia marginata]